MYGHIVLASTKGKLIPNAIKWFTKSVFSHSFITVPDVLSVPMCMEAAEGGVDFTRFDTGYVNDLSQGYEVWNIKVDQSIKDAAIIALFSDLEMSYGFAEYFYFLARKLCLVLGRDIKNQDNWFSHSGMICSQLCVAYIKACGLSYVLEGYGEGSISPQDLQDIMNAHPEVFEKISTVRLS